jgi:hypothetical protein
MDTSEESMAAFTTMGADPWFNPEVETTLPDTIIESGPQKTVAERDANFVFTATGKTSGFECRLGRQKWQSCASPLTHPGLPDGKHTFEVRAIGTGGRPDPTPARRDWVVDTTGPQVTATNPKDGANDASTGTEITATFSEAIDPASIIDETFKLVAEATGEVVTGKVSYDPATRKARLRPDRGLLPLGAYKAMIMAGVRDLVGNAMPTDHEWSFQTKADVTPTKPPSAPEPGPSPGPEPGPSPAPQPKPPAPPPPPGS